jgi:hypothetical protein
MIKYVERAVVKAIAVGKMVYHEGDPCRNANGGDYTEGEYVFTGEDKRHYRCYFTSADFDFCPLFGTYGSCDNCPSGYTQWDLEHRVCKKCPDKNNCSFEKFLVCSSEYDHCQAKNVVFIEYQGRLYRCLPID